MKSLGAGLLKIGFLCAFLFVYTFAFGQYKVSGEIIDVGSSYADVTITKSIAGKKERVPVQYGGHFTTLLQWNKVYWLQFEKPGYVSKVIEFNTMVPDSVYRNGIEPYDLSVRLFRTFDGVDSVFFEKPVAKIHYCTKKNDFDHDKDYSLMVKYKIEAMMQQPAEQKKTATANQIKIASNSQINSSKQLKNKVPTGGSDKEKRSTAITKKSEEKGLVVTDDSESQDSAEEILGIPPLKKVYPLGRTDERFELQGRVIERTVFNFGNVRKVYFSVKHHWGGEYYFIDEGSIVYRCVSKTTYYKTIERLMISNAL